MSNLDVSAVREMLDSFPGTKTRDLLRALCAEVEKLRAMDAERASELRYLEAENTRLRDILDRRFEGGAP